MVCPRTQRGLGSSPGLFALWFFQRRKHSTGQAHLPPTPPSPRDKPCRWPHAKQADSGCNLLLTWVQEPAWERWGSGGGRGASSSSLQREPAGDGGPEKQEGNAQSTLQSRGWKRVWVQTRAPGRGVRFPEGRAGSELASPHTPGMVPPLPPQPRLYVDPLTHWWGLESLPYARTWGGHHCTLAVSLGLGVVGEAGAGLGPFPYSY